MTKKTLILAGVLAVLVGLAYAYQGPIKSWQDNLKKPKNFLAALDVSRVDKMSITGGGKETVLVKEGSGWSVSGSKFKAAASDISEAISALDKASKAEIEYVSTNKEKKKDFRTDNQTGTQIKLFGGGKEFFSLVIGKNASDYQSTYLSEPAIDSTYLVKNVNLSGVFARDEWRDRTIFSSDKEKIKKLRLRYPGSELSMEKDAKGEWKLTNPYPLNLKKEKLDRILVLMSSLTASAIPVQDFKPTGLDKNLLIAEASGDGVKNVLMVGLSNGKDQFYAKRGDSDNIYLISKEEKTELEKKPDQLK